MIKRLRIFLLRRRYAILLGRLTFALFHTDHYGFEQATDKLDRIRDKLKVRFFLIVWFSPEIIWSAAP